MTPPTPRGGSYECPKCGHGAYEAGELRASSLLGDVVDFLSQ